ncbi:hypothetical protein Y032_0323g2500 [Ancylostoma ceylanicum]|uniref:Uncharacterized protein n=1 Tax=Ancylostoma ceylanicum TaxID=53326 RepID=A0A016S0E8_9BILA|nr:hypothetical protein Y032_0323g2500 [Ancylostoma ceylanicum]
MLRSTSHIGGIGVSERGSVEMPTTPQSAVVEEKKLHLMIDNKYALLPDLQYCPRDVENRRSFCGVTVALP